MPRLLSRESFWIHCIPHERAPCVLLATLAFFAQTDPEALTESYVLINFRPVVTNKNWRMDCGVAGYDNTIGLPPFFPTRLRREDYIYRLWIQQDGIAAAHVDAAQTHTKSNYMRNPPAAEIFNEEVSNLLKRKIKASVTSLDELSIAFDYAGEATSTRGARACRRSACRTSGSRTGEVEPLALCLLPVRSFTLAGALRSSCLGADITRQLSHPRADRRNHV